MTFRSLYGIIILAVTTVAKINGEVSEWFKELVLKTSDPARDQGFESLPLRHLRDKIFIVYSVVFTLEKYPSGEGAPLLRE